MPAVQTPLKPIPQTCTANQSGYRVLFQNKNFMALWLGQIFSQIADRIIFVVFIALIVKYFGASERYNSYLYIAFTIPAILLTSIAGVFVDRWPRRIVLVSSNLTRAAFIALLPLVGMGANWLIFVLAFMVSTATQFFVPAEAATIPTIVPKENLIVANSLFTTTMMASVIFGFALSDPLINIFGLPNIHWALVGLFAISSVCLLFVRIPKPCGKTQPDAMQAAPTLKGAFLQFWQEIQEGVGYIQSHSMVRNGMLKLAVLFSTVVSVCILSIAFAKAYLFDDPYVAARKFAYIITYSGIGMALGAVLVGGYFRNMKRGYMVYGGFLLTGVCLSLLSAIGGISQKEHIFTIPKLVTNFIYLDPFHLTYRMVYTYSLAMVMGIGAASVAIPLQAMLHELIPEDKRGKVLGVQFTLLSTSSTAPALIAGLAVEHIGLVAALLLIGIPLSLLGLIGLYLRQTQTIKPANTGHPANSPQAEGAIDAHVTVANW